MSTSPRRDPVDEAIEVLHEPDFVLSENHEQRTLERVSESWTQDAVARRMRRPVRRTWATAAILLIAIGGVSFTASGALPRFVRWLRVELDGRTFEVPLDETGRGRTTIETENGRSHIDVQREEFPGGDRTTLQVQTNGRLDPLGLFAEETEDVVERLAPDAEERDRIRIDPSATSSGHASKIDLRELAQGTRLDAWIDESDRAHELVLMPPSPDLPARLFRVTRDPRTERTKTRFLGSLAPEMPISTVTSEVTRPDEDTVRVAFTHASGSSWTYTFRIGPGTIQADCTIQTQTETER